MDTRDRWLKFIQGDPNQQAEELLSEASAQLDEHLASRPGASHEILDLIGRRLEDGIDDETWGLIDNSLTAYLGAGPALLVTWMVFAERGDVSRLDEFERHASPHSNAVARSIMGTYGPELREAFDAWQQIPNDWRVFFRDVYQDQIQATHFIRIRLQKYNGEQVILEGAPDSFLALARNIVLTLHTVATPGTFNQEVLDTFEEGVTRLLSLMTADADGERTSEASAQSPAEVS